MRLVGIRALRGLPQWALVRLAATATEADVPAGGLFFYSSTTGPVPCMR
jgi:hypothetical protein